MQRRHIYILLAFSCILSIPWLASGTDINSWFDFPAWAVYSLLMSLVFAIVIAIVIGRYWDSLGQLADEGPDADAAPDSGSDTSKSGGKHAS